MGYPLYRGRRNTRRSSPLGSKLKITATFTNFGLIHLNIWKWVSQSVFPYASRRPRGFGRSHIRTEGFDRCCSERKGEQPLLLSTNCPLCFDIDIPPR